MVGGTGERRAAPIGGHGLRAVSILKEQPNELMSPAEVKSLTGGKARAGDQAKVLEELGIPHKVVGKRVVVSRYHVRDWLAGKPVTPSTKPNLALVR